MPEKGNLMTEGFILSQSSRVRIGLSWWRTHSNHSSWSYKRKTSRNLVALMSLVHIGDVPGKMSDFQRSGSEFRLKSHFLLKGRKVLVKKGQFQKHLTKVKIVV